MSGGVRGLIGVIDQAGVYSLAPSSPVTPEDAKARMWRGFFRDAMRARTERKVAVRHVGWDPATTNAIGGPSIAS